MELITIKEYNHRYEAEMAVDILKRNGIDALLKSDDCGGIRLHLGMTSGYKIQIDKDDLEKAKDILE